MKFKFLLACSLMFWLSEVHAASNDRLWAGQVNTIVPTTGAVVSCRVKIEISQGDYTSEMADTKMLEIETCLAAKTFPIRLSLLDTGDLYDRDIQRVIGHQSAGNWSVVDGCTKLDINDLSTDRSDFTIEDKCSSGPAKKLTGQLVRVW